MAESIMRKKYLPSLTESDTKKSLSCNESKKSLASFAESKKSSSSDGLLSINRFFKDMSVGTSSASSEQERKVADALRVAGIELPPQPDVARLLLKTLKLGTPDEKNEDVVSEAEVQRLLLKALMLGNSKNEK